MRRLFDATRLRVAHALVVLALGLMSGGWCAAGPSVRPMLPQIARVSDADGARREVGVTVGAGGYAGLVGSPLARGGVVGGTGFGVVRLADFEAGATAFGSGNRLQQGAGLSAFGRYRLDITPLLSVGLELSADSGVGNTAQPGERLGLSAGGAAGLPVALAFGPIVAYGGLSVGVGRCREQGTQRDGTPWFLWHTFPSLRVPLGALVRLGPALLYAELTLSGYGDLWFLPVPTTTAGAGFTF